MPGREREKAWVHIQWGVLEKTGFSADTNMLWDISVRCLIRAGGKNSRNHLVWLLWSYREVIYELCVLFQRKNRYKFNSWGVVNRQWTGRRWVTGAILFIYLLASAWGEDRSTPCGSPGHRSHRTTCCPVQHRHTQVLMIIKGFRCFSDKATLCDPSQKWGIIHDKHTSMLEQYIGPKL